MKRLLTLFVFIFCIIGFYSCESYTIQYPEEDVYESFSASIAPILEKDCKGCHPANNPPDLSTGNAYISLTTGGYVDTNDPENSQVYLKLNSSPHSAYTSKRNRDYILAWIQAGAPND